MSKICDHKNCEKEGKFKAPKDRSLKDYYWFCLEHIKEYNKGWNYYAGLSDSEYEKEVEADRLGKRPTWEMGHRITKEDIKNIDDPLSLFGRQYKKLSPFKSDSKEQKALQIFGISWPTTTTKIKRKYIELVKKTHPDMTGGKTEKKFKEINEAYSLLKELLKKS